jgi:peptide deformylase
MVRPIVKDIFFLQQKSSPATPMDLQIIRDLLDTLEANRAGCVGLAANMIGVRKRVIAVSLGAANLAMVNPEIVRREKPFETEEGCLSLSGVRKTTRYETIEVKYLDQMFRPHKQTFSGWTAQIIQHEIDHCDGILI